MDIQLYYREKGRGKPLILLHGNNDSGEYFNNQMDEFSAYFRVIAVDTRGHGNSPRGNAPFSIRQFAEDLKDFMDEKGIEKANILGFSDGANIAMCFAVKYPQRIEKLILNGGNLHPEGVKFHLRSYIKREYSAAKKSALKSADAKRDFEMLEIMAVQPDISVEELKNITAETLVLAGTRDVILKNHTRLIAKSIKKSKLCFIEGDHFIAQKNTGEYNSAALDFLRK